MAEAYVFGVWRGPSIAAGLDRGVPVMRTLTRPRIGHHAVVLEVTTLMVSVLIGSFIGRWWSILLAIPAGVLAQSMYSFEGFSDGEVASLFGVAAALGLAFGVALRKILVRRTSNATGSIE